jgi:hypothetical protein
MKTQFKRAAAIVAAIVLLLCAVAPIDAGPAIPYSTTVSATDTHTSKTFGFTAGMVIVSNYGADDVYIRWNGTAAVASTASLVIRGRGGKVYTFPPTRGPASIGIICDTGETATVVVDAFQHDGHSEAMALADSVRDFRVQNDLAVDGTLSVDAVTVDADVTVGENVAVTGAVTADSMSSATTIGSNGNITTVALFVVTPTEQTIADSGDGSAAAGTILATAGRVHVTCADADGCALTLSETSAANGSTLTIVNVGASNSLTIADSANVQETTGALTLGQRDNVTFCYVNNTITTWVQCGPVNNN